MVNKYLHFCKIELALFSLLTMLCGVSFAENYAVSADACDERQANDDKNTCENRAIDKASLAAIKSSGFLQAKDESLNAQALDVISYQIIDEYMFNVVHTVTFSDDTRVCIKLSANVEIDDTDLNKLIENYKTTDNQENVANIAEQIKKSTAIKPQNLNEKKLVYVYELSFWNGTTTNKYTDLIKELFSHSDYYYVTDNKSLADFVVEPIVTKSVIDKVDDKNNKMQMMLKLHISAKNMVDFAPLDETQNHFILYETSKDEQEVGDNLIKKLLERSAKNSCDIMDKYLQMHLELKLKQSQNK